MEGVYSGKVSAPGISSTTTVTIRRPSLLGLQLPAQFWSVPLESLLEVKHSQGLCGSQGVHNLTVFIFKSVCS